MAPKLDIVKKIAKAKGIAACKLPSPPQMTKQLQENISDIPNMATMNDPAAAVKGKTISPGSEEITSAGSPAVAAPEAAMTVEQPKSECAEVEHEEEEAPSAIKEEAPAMEEEEADKVDGTELRISSKQYTQRIPKITPSDKTATNELPSDIEVSATMHVGGPATEKEEDDKMGAADMRIPPKPHTMRIPKTKHITTRGKKPAKKLYSIIEASADMMEETPVEEEEKDDKDGAVDIRDTSDQGTPRISKVKQVTPRGKKKANELYMAIAQESGIAVKDVERVIKGLNTVGADSIKMNNVFRVPRMMLFTLKTIPARAQTTKTIFGKEVLIRAKPITKKLSVATLKPFKDSAMSC
jgi:hypothetical protein